ncbi:hypothetical protein Tco_1216448 [Tanacetum coccineum]
MSGTNDVLDAIPSILIKDVTDVAFHLLIGVRLRSTRGLCTMFQNSEVDVSLLKVTSGGLDENRSHFITLDAVDCNT